LGIEWFRDLTIVIMGLVTTVVLIFIAVIVYRMYRSIKPALLMVKAASKITYDTVAMVQESIKPLLSILTLIQGIRGGFESISKMFKKETNKGGDSDE
jgi:hypothetical protein